MAVRGGRYFQTVERPGDDHGRLFVGESPDDGTVLVDPNEWPENDDPDAPTRSMSWFVPSYDGEHVAYGVTEGGDEQYDVHVLRTRDSGEATDHGHESTDGVVPHAHGYGVGAYLETGVVGALFTLSLPLSMILFASTLFPEYGGGVVALAVAAYAVSTTVTMSAIGAGIGTLFGATAVSPRLHAAARAFGGVIVVGFAVSMLSGTVL